MKVESKLTYKFELTARELNALRSALEAQAETHKGTSKGQFAAELSSKITKQVNGCLEQLKQHFEAMLEYAAKSEDK